MEVMVSIFNLCYFGCVCFAAGVLYCLIFDEDYVTKREGEK